MQWLSDVHSRSRGNRVLHFFYIRDNSFFFSGVRSIHCFFSFFFFLRFMTSPSARLLHMLLPLIILPLDRLLSYRVSHSLSLILISSTGVYPNSQTCTRTVCIAYKNLCRVIALTLNNCKHIYTETVFFLLVLKTGALQILFSIVNRGYAHTKNWSPRR